LALRWVDIDWEHERITIHSPKTEHHPDGPNRVAPISPELRPYLEAAWDEEPEGTTRVITRYRDVNSNLRTQLLRIIKRAGVKSRPKLFQNMRSSREAELVEQYPIHVVCEWIGNSPNVAKEHYLQMREEYSQHAIANSGDSSAAESAAIDAKALPKTLPNEKAPSRTDSQETKKPSGLTTQGVLVPLVTETEPAPPRGDELPQETLGNTQISGIGGAESGAVDAADFLRSRWPGLTDQAVQRITSLIMAELATGDQCED